MSRPVRVAHVIHDLRPGGTERRLLSVVEGLDRRRFEPLLVCIDGLGELAADARALGVEPVVVGRTARYDARGIRHLARLLRSERVQIVHGWLSLANAFARVAATAAGVPVRIAAEGGVVTTTNRRRSRRDAWIDAALATLTDAYVANSGAVAESLRSRGVPATKITVIPNGIRLPPPASADEREELRRELGVGPGERLLGFVSRLDPEFKDHGTFLRSVAALARDGRPVRAALVGEGPARNALAGLVRTLGLEERVLFTGYRADARRVIGAVDVSVLLSYSEGFSNVLLESMAARTPLVATSIPPNREAVTDGVEALLVPVGDEPATTEAIRRLLDDDALAGRLARAAAERARRFSLEEQAERTMELYERLLRRKVATL
jgi:glycosyltransferase involved in cell wall biosynthesis